MTIELVLFVIVVALTLFNNGVQAYIHFEAYPLLRRVGKSEFAGYLGDYEARLMIPLMLPYGLTVLSNLALLVIRPEPVPLVGIIVALVLNIAVAVVTITLATPGCDDHAGDPGVRSGQAGAASRWRGHGQPDEHQPAPAAALERGQPGLALPAAHAVGCVVQLAP